MSLDTNPSNINDSFGTDSILAMNAIDGRQGTSNDNYEISWSYHPNNGLEVLYKLK